MIEHLRWSPTELFIGMQEQPSTTTFPERVPSPLHRRRFRRRAIFLVICLLLLVAAELTAKFGLGLGSPLLYEEDPMIEYLPRPDQDLQRFGNRMYINRFSQRSRDVPERKSSARDLRVLLIGDSIVFGGSQSDDAETCGSHLEQILQQRTGRPTTVLTIAAGSWGPANQLAYLRRFGAFDADAAAWVFPTGDWYDAPTFEPTVDVHPSYPGTRPMLALSELVGRYIVPRLTRQTAPVDPGIISTTDQLQTAPLTAGVELLGAAGVETYLFHWPTQTSLQNGSNEKALQSFAAAAVAEGAEFQDLTTAMVRLPDRGRAYFRDGVHPNQLGNRWLAEQLAQVLLRKSAHADRDVPGAGAPAPDRADQE